MIVAAGGSAAACRVDVADPPRSPPWRAPPSTDFGGIDFLVNNAAIFGGMKLDVLITVDWDYLRRFLDVNMLGALSCTRACYPSMAARGGGAIVNQSSTAAYLYAGYYGWAKAGINSLTQQLAHELGGMHIRVNAIAPGPTDTEATRSVVPEAFLKQMVGVPGPEAPGHARGHGRHVPVPVVRRGGVGDGPRLQRRRRTGHAPVTAASEPPAGAGVLEVVDDGAVQVLRFNRPEARNAFNAALYHAVTDALATDGGLSRGARGGAHR